MAKNAAPTYAEINQEIEALQQKAQEALKR